MSDDDGKGLKCQNCGNRLRAVDRTVTTDGFVVRQRRCLKCGELNTTSERVIASHAPRRTFNRNE